MTSGVAHALRRQNVDPESRWSGLFEGYDPPEGTNPADHRWDTFLTVKGMGDYRGDSCSAAEGLAKAATLDEAINPYFGKRELLFRAAAAGLRDLMILNEAEVWPGGAADPYPSGMSSVMGQKNLPPFAIAAPHLTPDVRTIWTEGMRRMVDCSLAGVEVRFGEPQDLRAHRDGLVSNYRTYKVNRVEVVLPARMTAGQRARLAYTLRPAQR